MSEDVLQGRYARALFETTSQEAEREKISKWLVALAEIMAKHPELIRILNHPAIEIKQKQAFLEELFKNKPLPQELKSFLYLVIKNGRLALLEGIIKVYQDLLDSHQRRLRVEVNSTFPLAKKEQSLLETKLKALFHKKIELKLKVDKALFGGIRIKVADTIYDASLRRRLTALKEAL